MKKKLLCLILAALMILSIMPATAFAANAKCERPLQFEENIATELKKLNLFKGVSETDFALRKIPSRIEALVIMLRLMGKEAEILAGSYKHPFTDVPSWANNYVGYAYENGLTKGISASKFGTDNATDVQFLTFVLRAMGYSDSNGDFTWDNPYDLATKLGVLDCSVTTGAGFLRADCASISYNALDSQLKEGGKTLADKLIADGVFTKLAYDIATETVPDYADLIKSYRLMWHEYPVTQDDHIDNICYCLAAGNFDWTYNWNGSINIPDISILKAELAGYVMNQSYRFCVRQGRYYIAIDPTAVSPLSPEEISTQIVDAYKTAKKIHDSLHANGKITDSMTEKQIAEAYSSYMQSYGAKAPESFSGDSFPDDYDNPRVRILYIVFDTAYGCLVNKIGNCGSRAAAYNLLMNMEDIYTIGIHTEGHIVSYLWLDGKEYLCDWGNRIGLFTEEDVNTGKKAPGIKWAEGWLEIARKYYQNGAVDKVNMMPELEWEYIETSNGNKKYFVKLVPGTYNLDNSAELFIAYGTQGNYCGSTYSVTQLKAGVILSVGVASIETHNIPENIFVARII